jgi:hypothetical protein
MMRLKSYILLADPAWLEVSVSSYYPVVNEILARCDATGRGLTGVSISIDQSKQILRAMDAEHKIRFSEGVFYRLDLPVGDRDTFQRNSALIALGSDADWILQIDTDEFVPDINVLLDALRFADEKGLCAVEWPMRVLYRRLRTGEYLEVCQKNGGDHYEYPGAVAVKPLTHLSEMRRTRKPFLRPIVEGDSLSLQIQRPPMEGECRDFRISRESAIVHNSWAREPSSVWRKLRSWAHHDVKKLWIAYYLQWLLSPLFWRTMVDFHPFARDLWRSLRVSDAKIPISRSYTGNVELKRSCEDMGSAKQ